MMEVINLREDRYPIRRKHVTVTTVNNAGCPQWLWQSAQPEPKA
jgi:hypothetical protein